MISGPADERIAFVIDTEARLDGLRQGREGINDLTGDTQRFAQATKQSMDQAVNSVETMSARSQAAFERLGESQKRAFEQNFGTTTPDRLEQMMHLAEIKRSAEEDIAAIRRLGEQVDVTSAEAVAGFKAIVDAQRELFVEAEVGDKAIRQLDAAWREVEKGAMSAGKAQAAAVNEAARAADQAAKLQDRQMISTSRHTRSAAASASTLAFALTGMSAGGVGAARSAGMLAMQLGMLTNSARLAASATGLGAIITVGVAIISIMGRMEDKAKKLDDTFKGLRGFMTLSAQYDRELARLNRELEKAEQAIEDAPGIIPERQAAARHSAILEQITEVRNLGMAARRQERMDAEAEGKRLADDARAAARQVIAIKADMEFQTQRLALDGVNQRVELQTLEARRSYDQRVQEIRDIETSESQKTQLIVMARAERDARIASIDRAEAIRRAEEAKRGLDLMKDVEHAMVIAVLEAQGARGQQLGQEAGIEREMEQRRAAIDKALADEQISAEQHAKAMEQIERTQASRIQSVRDAAAKQRQAVVLAEIQAITRSQESLITVLRRAALEPIISRLEGIAAKEIIEAMAQAAALNWSGAAQHAAVAAAATAAARQVASWAGGSSKGSTGGGGAGASGGGGSTFEPRREGGSAGMLVLNLYSQNPYGREQIGQVRHRLDRAGVLKEPMNVQLPFPTNGFIVTGGD